MGGKWDIHSLMFEGSFGLHSVHGIRVTDHMHQNMCFMKFDERMSLMNIVCKYYLHDEQSAHHIKHHTILLIQKI